MSDRATILESSWKVFIDGVEVPHQGFQIQFQKNNLSACNITLEPDKALTSIRPQSVVSIFAKERFVEDDNEYEDDLDVLKFRYYLFWEGLTAGYSYQKSPQSRAFNLKCESIFSPWRRTQAFMFGVGPASLSPIISGATAVNPDPIAGGDIFSLIRLGDKVAQDATDPFADRLVETVNYLSSTNAMLRLQTSRYSLLERISSIKDDIYETILAPMASGLLSSGTQALSEMSTVFDVLNHLQSYGFYSNYELPCPTPGSVDDRDISAPFEQDELYDYAQFYQLNQFMFLPEMYFAPPPPCNFIFPDHIRSLAVDRDFYSEPTRILVTDPYAALSSRVIHLSPPSILRNTLEGVRDQMTAAEVFAQANAAITGEVSGVESPYQSNPTGENRISLFETVLNSELEKGIVARMESYRFETLAAVSHAKELPEDVIDSAYTSFLTSVINYRHKLDRFTRAASVELSGHRDIVPGFPCIIFDGDGSYYAQVDSAAFSVDPLGTEITNVTLSKARAVTQIDLERLNDLRTGVSQGIEIERIAEESPATLNEFRRLKAKEKASAFIENVLNDIQEESDVAAPPAFFNPELLDPIQLDRIYGKTLGCKPFYTTKYSDNSPTSDLGRIQQVTAVVSDSAQYAGLFMHIRATKALNNVYKMFDAPVNDTPVADSWQDISTSSNALGPTTFEWASRNFTKRKRYYLRDYCHNNNLELQRMHSFAPSTVPFYRMMPAELMSQQTVAGPTSAIERPGWDNTLFSKLVLEGQNDPVIDELRDEAPDYLKTLPRQEVIVEYSQRHFGSRAFNGS